MISEDVLGYVVVASLLVMLYVGPSYFRRLRELTERLKTFHADIYAALGEPTTEFSGITVGNSSKLVRFLLLGNFYSIQDEETVRIAASARRRLVIGFLVFIVIALAGPVAGYLSG